MLTSVYRFHALKTLCICFVWITILLGLYQYIRQKRIYPRLKDDFIIPTKHEVNIQTMQTKTCLDVCWKLLMESKAIKPQPVKYELYLNSRGMGEIRSLSNAAQYFETTLPNGAWAYVGNKHHRNKCTSMEHQKSFSMSVAVIIPFSERWDQLPIVIDRLVALLQHQGICYRIFVVEQTGSSYFNRAKLFNIGYTEAKEAYRFRCVIFHDVDLIPMNNDIPYGCDTASQNFVNHLSVAIDARNYTLTYQKLVGGVLKMSRQHFEQVNGYSNLFWGWGQEDDDMERRLTSKNISYRHFNAKVARYHAIPHKRHPKVKYKTHLRLLRTSKIRLDYDGLNSLKYTRVGLAECALYTHILVDVGESGIQNDTNRSNKFRKYLCSKST